MSNFGVHAPLAIGMHIGAHLSDWWAPSSPAYPGQTRWRGWTLTSLGITGALYRTLRTTNPIENLNGSVARYCRNVKRWGDGQMVLRWVASALSDAATRMRKLRGCAQMKALLKALDSRRTQAVDGATLKAA